MQTRSQKTVLNTAVELRKGLAYHQSAQPEDAQAAYHWLLDQGHDPGQIVFAGDSSGGGLAVASMIALRENQINLPAGGVCISPWVDLAQTGNSIQTKAEIDPILMPETIR